MFALYELWDLAVWVITEHVWLAVDSVSWWGAVFCVLCFRTQTFRKKLQIGGILELVELQSCPSSQGNMFSTDCICMTKTNNWRYTFLSFRPCQIWSYVQGFKVTSLLVCVCVCCGNYPQTGWWELDSALSCSSIIFVRRRGKSHEGYQLNVQERWIERERGITI